MNNNKVLNMEWNFGFDSKIYSPILYLTTTKVAYGSGQNLIVYDFEKKKQKILLGHLNRISAFCLSEDKRYLVSADKGNQDQMIIVWDVETLMPVNTIFTSIDTIAMDMRESYLAALSSSHPQTLSIWEWTEDNENNSPKNQILLKTHDLQQFILFNQNNVFELMTNGDSSVSFYQWDEGGIKSYTPVIDVPELKKSSKLTRSVFLPYNEPSETMAIHALTGTSNGEVILWTNRNLDNLHVVLPIGEKHPVKLIKLQDKPIISLNVFDKLYIMSVQENAVKVHDMNYRLIGTFQLPCSNVLALSFLRHEFPRKTLPECVYATTEGKVYKMDSFVHSKVIVESVESLDAIKSIATHPTEPYFVVCAGNSIYGFDYVKHCIVEQKYFDCRVNVARFSCNGLLGVGTATGIIKILNQSWEEIPRPSVAEYDNPNENKFTCFKCSSFSIEHLEYSKNGVYLAACDSKGKISVIHFVENKEDPSKDEWFYLGNYKAHYESISRLLFNDEKTLISIGKDKHIVTYDLESRDRLHGVKMSSRTKFEESTAPLTADFYGKHIIFSTDDFKLKLMNPVSHIINKTVICPLTGFNLSQLVCTEDHLFFQSGNILGVLQLPLSGNPGNSFCIM
jgi:WD40 repeat protein